MNTKLIFLIMSLLLAVSCVSKNNPEQGVTVTDEQEGTPTTTTEAAPPVTETTVATLETTTTTVSEEAPDPAQDNSPGIEIIKIEELKFKPKDLTIDKGTTVKWVHNDKYEENERIVHQLGIYGKDISFYQRSERMMLGDSFNYTFTEKGNYWYLDIIFKERMKGTITVE